MIQNLLLRGVQMFLCIFAHECGHILVARFNGVQVNKIGVGWMGIFIRRARTTGWPEVSICLAGPAVNLALCNFFCAWMNLLPLPHSDGLHAFRAWRELRREIRWQKLMDRIATQPEPKGNRL